MAMSEENQTAPEEDWKDKYLKALLVQDDTEERYGLLYKELLIAFGHFRGREQSLDSSISKLPGVSAANEVTIDTLKDLNRQIANILDHLTESQALDEENQENISSSTQANPFAIAKDSLIYLIEQLPADISQKLDEIKLNLSSQDHNDVNSLRTIADEIQKVLVNVLSEREQKINELSKFMSDVARRLGGLQDHLQDEKNDRHQSSNKRDDLNQLIGNNIKQLRASVAEADNIDSLKQVIDSSLDEVGSQVTSFVDAEAKRADKAESSSAALEIQLQKLQTKTTKLRQSLETAITNAMVDPLTNIPNRRAYDERFKIEYNRWKRKLEPLTLAIMDIDHFKQINDTYGHPIGDKVLTVIASRIHQQVRESDFFGRIGGEEFAFILVNSPLENALDKVEALRKSIEACHFSMNKKTFKVTLSIGLASFKSNDSIDIVYSRADQALVKAKQTGRNQTLSELDL